jgi:hypothetical protein
MGGGRILPHLDPLLWCEAGGVVLVVVKRPPHGRTATADLSDVDDQALLPSANPLVAIDDAVAVEVDCGLRPPCHPLGGLVVRVAA